MNKKNRIQALALVMAVGGLAAWAVTPSAAQPSRAEVSRFELTMRILEGVREKAVEAPKPVTSSFLRFTNLVNVDVEADLQAEQQIKKVYSLKDVSLLTEASLVWEKGKAEKAIHMFRLNGREYLIMVTPGRLLERNRFRIEVFEQSGGQKASLLDTEFSLPEKNAAVFGFEDTELKPYFISLRLVRWSGVPGGVGGGVGGGLGGGVASGQVLQAPKLVKQVDPVYPGEARKAGIQGLVVLEGTTDLYGRVASVKVLQSIPALDQAAIDALKQWVYEPMVVDGKPHPLTFTVTMRFSLMERAEPSVGGVTGGVSGGVAGGVIGGVVGGVAGGTKGGVAGGVTGGVQGGVTGGVIGGVASAKELEKFEEDAVRVGGEIKQPKLLTMVRPVYPKVARQGRVEGIVILEAKVDEQGNVIDARLLRSIPVLDQAAVDAVKQWKYEPMVVDGKPRKALITVTVRFMLDEAENRAMSKFAQGAVRAEGDIKPPMLVKEVPAVYPEVARLARVQGVVILGVKTDERGKVIDVIVLRSIPLLDQAAIDAVRQWTYEPLVVEGKAVPAVFTATVRFKLQESPLIKPGDTLDIDVNGLPDFRAACQVSAAGSITYRMLGDVRVANLSLDEAGERLARLLKPYLREPRVTMTFGQAPAKKFPAP